MRIGVERPRSTAYKKLSPLTDGFLSQLHKMVRLSFFVLLSSALLVTASVIPIAEMKRELENPTLVAREPEYPFRLTGRDASVRGARRGRPNYGALSDDER